MRTTRSVIRPAATLAALLLVAGAAHANLLQNGSFESPAVPVGGYTNYLAGSTAITGWTVVGVDSAVTSGSFAQNGITFQAQDGVQFIDLAGVTSNSKSSGVAQSFASVAGATYELKFYVGSSTDGAQFFASTVDLSINGGTRTSFRNPTAPRTALDWQLFTVDFIATGASTSLTFYNGSESNNFLGALDNVSVDRLNVVPGVPEPADSLLMLAGLGALVGWRMSRRDPR